MKKNRSRSSGRWFVAMSMALSSHAFAAGPASDSSDAQYEAERTRCMAGNTGQEQASCLRSAAAARDALRQNRLNDANSTYRDNALSRCRTLPADQRADCEARIDGGGTSSGSVKDGGIIRETVTTTTGIPAPTQPTVPVQK